MVAKLLFFLLFFVVLGPQHLQEGEGLLSIGISESADTSPATSMPNASTSPVLALVHTAGKHSLQHCLCYSFILWSTIT